MKIAGFVKNSFVDYPNKISAVIFTYGCNFNCWYCHNKHILKSDVKLLNQQEIFDFLNKRKGLIDAVVISGGEPTLQNDLDIFITKIKKMGYLVKLDTNGSNPNLLQDLIDKKLIDYIAMDIKNDFENYSYTCGVKVNIENIKKSIDILLSSKIDYEFRTTLAPEILEENFENMIQFLAKANKYYLQKCNIPKGYAIPITNHKATAEKFLEKAKKNIHYSCLRGFD